MAASSTILLMYTCFFVFSIGQNYVNPNKNITCGKYENCFIHCSTELSCGYPDPIYIVFENDWSVTKQKYNATLICASNSTCNNYYCYNPCQDIKIFANRSSSLNISFNNTFGIDLHILFGNYDKGPQIAKITCISCFSSEFYYSSLINNVSLISSPANGIVYHECFECADNTVISAMNIYQLQLTCHNESCKDYIVVYPPIHQNQDSFVLISNSTGLADDFQSYFFFYFLNGLHGKKIVCDICDGLPFQQVRIYCGPNFLILEDASYILSNGSSKNCPSIYEASISYQISDSESITVTPTCNGKDIFFFTAHRLYTEYNYHSIPYHTYLQNNDTAIFIMADTHLPNETIEFDMINLPAQANIFIFCQHCNGDGDTREYKIWNGSTSSFLTIVDHQKPWGPGYLHTAKFYGGIIFNFFALTKVRGNYFYLSDSNIVYMVGLEDYWDFYWESSGSKASIYEYSYIYISDPILFKLDCSQGYYCCDDSYLFSTCGKYEYLPVEWDISCYYNEYDTQQSVGCDPFQITVGDGAKCWLDASQHSTCTNWQKGHPTPSPTKSPSFTPSPTISFNTHSIFGSMYSIIGICSIAFLLCLVSGMGYIHKCCATNTCCMRCLKPADDSKPFAVIIMSLGVWNFLSDWNWAFSLDADQYKYYLYASISINIFSWAMNLAYLFKLIYRYKQDGSLAAWLRSYALFLIMFAVVCGNASTAICLCNCHLFGISLFEMGLPLFSIQIEINRWKTLFNSVLQNTPQIFLQMLYTSAVGELNTVTLFAMLSSACSVVLSIAIFVIQAGTRWNPKTYEIQVLISNKDAMDPLLRKRRYLRGKTALVISETISVDRKCIEIQKIIPPLVIILSINDERDEKVILRSLNEHTNELERKLAELFCLSDDIAISIESKSQNDIYNVNSIPLTASKNSLLEDLLDNNSNDLVNVGHLQECKTDLRLDQQKDS